MIIQIFQLLYLNYNKEVIVIISDNKLNNQIFYNILKNFLECNIIDDVQNNNEEISKDKIYLKEIIKNYLLFSIHYLNDNYNFDIEISNNFNFEKYIEIINNNLEELISKIILSDINLYLNEKIEKSLFDILIYSKLYIENKDDNLKNYLFNISKNIREFLIKIIKYEIENNMIYKQKNKDIPNN